MIKIPGHARMPRLDSGLDRRRRQHQRHAALLGRSVRARPRNAYIEGLEDRVKAGQPIDKIASVASVFVSRIDTAIDKTLDERIAKGEKLDDLKGKAGIANLKLTYQKFEQLFHSDRFAALKAKGAKVQRPLWASTSTKNPKYDDLMYVVNVVGADTVNTMPPATIDALLDHGVVKPDTIHDDVPGAKALDRSARRPKASRCTTSPSSWSPTA